jgi:hypothetical protein
MFGGTISVLGIYFPIHVMMTLRASQHGETACKMHYDKSISTPIYSDLVVLES